MDYSFVEEIRILPNDKKTFPAEKDFKTFISKTLIQRGGIYYFPNLMMRCKQDTLVLFQYNGMIRATGVLIETIKTKMENEFGEKHAGCYIFDVETVKYLDNPIDAKTLQTVCPSFRGFNQSKQKLPIECLNSIACLL